MKRRTFAVALAGAVAAGLAGTRRASASDATPRTIPALRQWNPGGAPFRFATGSRIVMPEADAGALTATAQVFATDLRSLTGVPIETAVGTARSGDLLLARGPVSGGDEAYRMSVAPVLAITGGTGTGVFNGTRTVLQLLRQNHTLGGGTAVDEPVYPERGLLLDLGRKYFSLNWLRERIREMSYLKLNYLHLHLNDVFGFRLESERHPEIVSAQHYTQQEIRDLIEYAARYHVQVVPEIDMPGHLDPVLAAHPGLKLVDKSGEAKDSLIDLANPDSYVLMRELIEEYLPLFPSRYFHVGGDEYLSDYRPYPQLETYARQHYGPNATAKDTFFGYLNWASGIVEAAGKTARAWNDGIKPGDCTLTVNPGTIIEHWSMSGPVGLPWSGPACTARQLVDAGHRVTNLSFTPTYYTMGLAYQLITAPPSAMYDGWDPARFVDGTRVADPTRNLGSKVSLWCNDPDFLTERQTADVLGPRLRVLAQQTWGSPKPAPNYPLYLPIMHAVGDAPT